MKISKLQVTLALSLTSFPLLVHGATSENNLVLGGNAHSATQAITSQATQTPGDIYRGTVFGAEQKNYHSDIPGTRPYAKTKQVYDTSLIRAIKISDIDRVRTLLYANADVNEKNYAGITPMTIAAEKGNMGIIRLLVEDGKADINDPSSYGVTPLISAAAAGKGEVVSYLLSHGANAIAKDDMGKTALIYASKFDDAQTLADLTNFDKTSLNLPDNSGNTALIYSAQRGYENNVKVLLRNGANINYRNPSTGLSALAVSSAEGHLPVVKLLLKNSNVDVNLPDMSGRTPIFYALEKDQIEVLRLLMANGANINAQDHAGVSPLMRASAKNKIEIQELLLRQKDIDVNAKDNLERNVVAYSVYAEELTPLQNLLKTKADINLPDAKGNTPLMDAIKAKKDRTALYLIQQGSNLATINQGGETVFDLTDKYLPNSSTAAVLGVKRQEIAQKAMQVEAEKLATMRQLEEELAQEQAIVDQLKEEQATQLAQEKAAQEAKQKQELAEKEAAVRKELAQEYEAKTAALETDPEILQLQAQLEATKAKKTAALQAEIDQRVDEKMGRKPAQATVAQQAPKNQPVAKKQPITRRAQTSKKGPRKTTKTAPKTTVKHSTPAKQTLSTQPLAQPSTPESTAINFVK